MTDGKITVLHVLGNLNVGGAENRIMDLLRHIDRDKIQYMFLLHSVGPDAYEEEAKSLGCQVYRVPRFWLYNIAAYKKAMKKFFTEHQEIDIVQGHITSSAAIYLPIAKKCGIKITIAHNRNAGVDKNLRGFVTNLLTKNMDKKCDYMWACSTEAAINMYGKDNYDKGLCRIIPNAVDMKKYSENNSSEIEKVAQEFNLKDKFVVGHVGRIDLQKNHLFLVDVFNEILKLKDNAVLLLVGRGDLEDEVKKKVKNYGIEDRVIFAGKRNNVKDFLRNMDVIVFPSFNEGLPGAIVEAQSSFVPCLLSDAITRDIAVTRLIDYEKLESSPEKWAKHTLELYDNTRDVSQEEVVSKMRESGFDVAVLAEKMKDLYISMMQNK